MGRVTTSPFFKIPYRAYWISRNFITQAVGFPSFCRENADIRKELQAETGRGRMSLAVDLAWCRFRYNLFPEEYRWYRLYRQNHWGRKGYLPINNHKCKLPFRSPENQEKFENKRMFNQVFSAFVRRAWLYAPEHSNAEILSFIRARKTVFAKPCAARQGKGTLKLSAENMPNPAQFCEMAREQKYLLEEVICQHPDLAALNPNSVNTVRMNSLIDRSGRVHLFSPILRCASGETILDNLCAGGIATGVDLDTGILLSCGSSRDGRDHVKHPYSGVVLPGFQVPLWQEVKDFAIRAAKTVPELRLAGWDIAITPGGPEMVEGNHDPNPLAIQHNREGVLELFSRYA